MPLSYAKLVNFSRQFQARYHRQFLPLLEQWDLTMREIHVLLFLVSHPELDTARDVWCTGAFPNPRYPRQWKPSAAEGFSPGRQTRRTGGWCTSPSRTRALP